MDGDTIRRWLNTRRLGRLQKECWPLAMHLDYLYTLLHIVQEFKGGVQKVQR